MSFVRDLSEAKREYDKLKNALSEAESKGYGIVLPSEREVKSINPVLKKAAGDIALKSTRRPRVCTS